MPDGGSGGENANMAFEAWALPPGAAPPARTRALPAGTDPGGMRLTYADLSADEMRAVCRGLRSARSTLLDRTAFELAELLGRVGARFLDPSDPLRTTALEGLPDEAGISPAMAREILDGMARDWLPERLRTLLALEFEDPAVLDGFVTSRATMPERTAGPAETAGRVETFGAAETAERAGPAETSGANGASTPRRLRALGPALALHLGAGNVPGVSVTSLVRGLLVKSPVLLKPGRGDALLPVLFARGLAEEDPAVARAVAVVYWPGGEGEGEAEALRQADLVIAYGGEPALRAIRDRLPLTTRFLPYHHRISFGVITREAASRRGSPSVARAVSRSAALFDRRGCVSPHVVYVEDGGEVGAREWAGLLANALREVEASLPTGFLSSSEASEVHQVRGTVEMNAAAGTGTELHSDEGLGWTVIYDPDPDFEASCPGRTVRVKPLRDLEDLEELVRPYSAVLQTVGLAGPGDAPRWPGPAEAAEPVESAELVESVESTEAAESIEPVESPGSVGAMTGIGGAEGEGIRRLDRLAEALARAGAFRITSFERLPWPPPWWHHDGAGPLRALVRWVEVDEREG